MCCCLLCRRLCFLVFTLLWFIVGTFVGGFVVKGLIAAWYYKDKDVIKDMVLNGAFYRLDWLHVIYGFSLSLVVYLAVLGLWAAFCWVCCCGCCRRGRHRQDAATTADTLLPEQQQQRQRGVTTTAKGATRAGGGGRVSMEGALRPIRPGGLFF